jgi:hypothetical protein
MQKCRKLLYSRICRWVTSTIYKVMTTFRYNYPSSARDCFLLCLVGLKPCNKQVRIKIYRVFNHCIVYVVNEGRHIIIAKNINTNLESVFPTNI